MPGHVHLAWRAVLDTDLMGYKLYYSEGVGTEEMLYVGINTTYDLEFLKPDRVYSFRITAIDTAGNESTGSIVKAYLPPL